MSYPTDKILGKDGLLAHSLEDFEFRPSQIQMAQLINDCVQRKDFVIIEAGTGTGKTLGYLVPLVQSGKKTVISTGTKNLQEQIFLKDIPLLEKALDFKIDSLLMKGRTNYLCRHKYLRYISQSSLIVPDKEKTQQKIEEWLKQTEFADRAELHWLTDDNPLWENISATSEQCLGSECMHFEECYLNEVRKRAAQSRIIIVNHHLFFADLKVKKGGFGEIIPRFQVAVFDEAHKLEEIATTYFGESLSTSQLLQLIKDVEKEVKGKRRKNLEKNLDLIRKGVDDLIGLFHDSINKGQMNKEILLKIHDGPSRHIRQGLNFIQQQAALNDFRSASFQNIANRAEEIVLSLEKICPSINSSSH